MPGDVHRTHLQDEPAGGMAIRLGYFVDLTGAGQYTATTDRMAATHTLEDDGAGHLTMVPLWAAATPAVIRYRGTSYLIRGA